MSFARVALLTLLFGGSASAQVQVLSPASRGPAPPTFYRDVLPILQNRCQECHRPGEMGPMPLTTYAETRRWAAAIREAVVSKKMPPWFADPCCGHFANDRSLSAGERETLIAWADARAPEGNS